MFLFPILYIYYVLEFFFVEYVGSDGWALCCENESASLGHENCHTTEGLTYNNVPSCSIPLDVAVDFPKESQISLNTYVPSNTYIQQTEVSIFIFIVWILCLILLLFYMFLPLLY